MSKDIKKSYKTIFGLAIMACIVGFTIGLIALEELTRYKDEINTLNQTILDMNKTINNQNTIIEYCNKNNPIMIAKTESQKHEYDINSYNCFDYSQDLNRVYWENGFEADVLGGWYSKEGYILKQYSNTTGGEPEDKELMSKGYGAHAWVKVCAYIEATTGTFINKENIINRVD